MIRTIISSTSSQRERVLRRFILATAFLMTIMSTTVQGADTVETWEAGAFDVDFYSGLDGADFRGSAYTTYSDLMLGYGVTDQFSVYLGYQLQMNRLFDYGSTSAYFGVFGTPLQTGHFTLDLFLDVSVHPTDTPLLETTPALEFNFDRPAGRNTWGLYFRSSLPISRPSNGSTADSHSTVCSIVLNPGAYYTFASRHQILIEYDMSYNNNPVGNPPLEIGGLAFGYNVVLNERIELINQVAVDLPQRHETPLLSVMTGFIATLP